MVGSHPLVLSPTWKTERQIRQGHRVYHYLAGGVVYSGIFVDKEVT